MSNYPHGAAAAAANKRLCGITILRDEYHATFGEAYPKSDDSIFDILESFEGLPPVRDLDSRSIVALVAVLRAYIRCN